MGLDESRRVVWDALIKQGYYIETESDWLEAKDMLLSWFVDVKAAESDDTFHEAFKDDRMTLRCILEERHTGHYVPEKIAPKGRGQLQDNVAGIRQMQGIAGMKERMTHTNYFGHGGKLREEKAKYTKGLFDVSACLLDGERTLEIGADQNQMYRTSGNTTYVFMPVPREEDMLNYCLIHDMAKSPLNKSQGFKIFVEYMKSRLSRIKYAFEGDAGAIFVNFAPEGELYPKIKYGFGNIMKRWSTPEQIRKRRVDSLLYTTILKGTNRNEIIVAYRQHGLLAKQPSAFPVYAKGVFVKTSNPNEPDHKGFVVIDDQYRPTGKIIDLDGAMWNGTEDYFGPGASIANHSPPKTK
jgi:hypothetical protein